MDMEDVLVAGLRAIEDGTFEQMLAFAETRLNDMPMSERIVLGMRVAEFVSNAIKSRKRGGKRRRRIIEGKVWR